MSKDISRRDFLKAGAIATVVALLPKWLSNGDYPPIDLGEIPKENNVNGFTLEKEITQIEVNSCRQMFARVANGVEQLKQNLETSDIDFDGQIFAENTSLHVDKMVRLQRIYKQFDSNTNIDTNIRSEALKLIRYNFNKLAIPINIFNRVNNQNSGVSDVDLAKKLLLDARDLVDEVPVDPLLGMEIYSQVGMQTWFVDFDIKYVDGNAVGTYPVTRRFIKESGKLFCELTNQAGSLNEKGNLPDERPGRFEYGAERELIEDNGLEYKQIMIEKEVMEKIYNELKKSGVDRAMANLVLAEFNFLSEHLE